MDAGLEDACCNCWPLKKLRANATVGWKCYKCSLAEVSWTLNSLSEVVRPVADMSCSAGAATVWCPAIPASAEPQIRRTLLHRVVG